MNRRPHGNECERTKFSTCSSCHPPYNQNRKRVVEVKTAEISQCAATTMMATRTSFLGNTGNWVEKGNADIEKVCQGTDSNPCIGRFLFIGTSFGSRRPPKKAQVRRRIKSEHGQTLCVLASVEAGSYDQKPVSVIKVSPQFCLNLAGNTFGLWGQSFKSKINDIRYSLSWVLVHTLPREGAHQCTRHRTRSRCPGLVTAGLGEFTRSPTEPAVCRQALLAVQSLNALINFNDWNTYCGNNFSVINVAIKPPLIFEGRNLYKPAVMALVGLDHRTICRHTE